MKYIRFKDIPPDERSGVYDGDLGAIRHEDGVSCYDCVSDGEKYRVVLPSLFSGALNDLLRFERQLLDGEIPAYLIEATPVGVGSYGEPVVRDASVVSELKLIEQHNPPPHFKMDRTNPQLVATQQSRKAER